MTFLPHFCLIFESQSRLMDSFLKKSPLVYSWTHFPSKWLFRAILAENSPGVCSFLEPDFPKAKAFVRNRSLKFTEPEDSAQFCRNRLIVDFDVTASQWKKSILTIFVKIGFFVLALDPKKWLLFEDYMATFRYRQRRNHNPFFDMSREGP